MSDPKSIKMGIGDIATNMLSKHVAKRSYQINEAPKVEEVPLRPSNVPKDANQVSAIELINMNRHDKRRIGKLNKIKIPGISVRLNKGSLDK